MIQAYDYGFSPLLLSAGLQQAGIVVLYIKITQVTTDQNSLYGRPKVIIC